MTKNPASLPHAKGLRGARAGCAAFSARATSWEMFRQIGNMLGVGPGGFQRALLGFGPDLGLGIRHLPGAGFFGDTLLLLPFQLIAACLSLAILTSSASLVAGGMACLTGSPASAGCAGMAASPGWMAFCGSAGRTVSSTLKESKEKASCFAAAGAAFGGPAFLAGSSCFCPLIHALAQAGPQDRERLQGDGPRPDPGNGPELRRPAEPAWLSGPQPLPGPPIHPQGPGKSGDFRALPESTYFRLITEELLARTH